MKLRQGYSWKHHEGLSKGKEFTIVYLDRNEIQYKSKETGKFYSKPRKQFEKYIEEVNNYWSQSNKDYKKKKEQLKGNE